MSTPKYVKNAQNRYNAKFELLQLKFPKGTKERIRERIGAGGSMSAYCIKVILQSLQEKEKEKEIDFFEQMQDFNGFSADFSVKNEDEEELPF